MPKLMTVRAEFEYVIVVEDEATELDIFRVAQDELKDASSDLASFEYDLDWMPYEHHKPRNWDDDCIPYGGDGNTRSGEYLK